MLKYLINFFDIFILLAEIVPNFKDIKMHESILRIEQKKGIDRSLIHCTSGLVYKSQTTPSRYKETKT